MRHNLILPVLTMAAFCMITDLRAAVTVTQLTPSMASPQPVGTTLLWTATVINTNPGPLLYRFSVGRNGSFLVLRDFAQLNTFEWTPSQKEGIYQVRVSARDVFTGEIGTLTVDFTATTRIVSGAAAVSATNHPLVALFSAPPCPSGSLVSALFWQSINSVTRTDWKRCDGTTSNNFYIAGMQANTTYTMNYQVATGGGTISGPTNLTFQTGTPSVTLPEITVPLPATQQADPNAKIVLWAFLSPFFPLATDRAGNVVWYYPKTTEEPFLTRPLYGETMLMVTTGVGGTSPTPRVTQVLREIDLAGNTVRETNADRLGAQLIAMGKDPITSVHHDAIRLPNGFTAVLGSIERMFPPGTQGSTSPDPVMIIADNVIVLDSNWQVVWQWNAFEHLDINRAAILGEKCVPDQGGCPPLVKASIGNDWTHANALFYDPADGNIIISMRHQDWLVKVNFSNGAGNGNVVWRMGVGGDFAINSADPYPWFSHQHDMGYETLSGNPRLMTVFDNTNTRRAAIPGSNSRGQSFMVDEVNKVVTPVVNADLGVFAFAVSSAQLLGNGNYAFDAGIFPFVPPLFSQTIEVANGTTQVYKIQGPPSYRSWLMPSLYLPPGT
jgi:hypothetical protein